MFATYEDDRMEPVPFRPKLVWSRTDHHARKCLLHIRLRQPNCRAIRDGVTPALNAARTVLT
jgi:hypothetical protein